VQDEKSTTTGQFTFTTSYPGNDKPYGCSLDLYFYRHYDQKLVGVVRIEDKIYLEPTHRVCMPLLASRLSRCAGPQTGFPDASKYGHPVAGSATEHTFDIVFDEAASCRVHAMASWTTREAKSSDFTDPD
jgi:hypothetical protein